MTDETVPTADELTRLKMSIGFLERDARDLEAVDADQWEWQLACVAAARRGLRLKHDRETIALAVELAREVLERLEEHAACDVAGVPEETA